MTSRLTLPFWYTVVIACSLYGCTPTPSEPADDSENASPEAPVNPDTNGESDTPVVALKRPTVPDDVFFEDPLAIASNSTQLPAANVADSEMMQNGEGGEGTPDEETPAEEVQSAAVNWVTLLPAETLHAEVLRIRDRFAPKLDGVADFNSSLLEFPPYMAEIAALAHIATMHSQAVPWKKDAKFVRELAAASMAEQLARGQKSYDQVKVPFDKISLLVDGKPAEELPEADDQGDFAFAADFGYVMRRLEIGQNSLQSNGSSEAAVSQNSETLTQEARVLAALSAAIGSADYGYGDDPTYQAFAKELQDAAVKAAEASAKKDYPAFDEAVNALRQSCDRCHAEYRNS